MKKTILTFILFSFSLFIFSQNKQKEATQAEQFSSQAGVLMERQFYEIGKIKALQVKVLKFKDLNSSATKSSLRFEYDHKSSYSSDTKIAALDFDELDGLIKSIKNLQTNVFTSTKEVYTEVTFTSRSGFEAGAYYTTDKNKWTAYVQVEKNDRNSMIFLLPEDFATLLSLVEQAKTKM
ncbi:hypothetical protein [Flavobacterium sp. MMS24-S5]|uniref:hypothetical protein n=1 Tax=Flavobacterium sp. MMS24-S5 TaxID=3416605 RepID=UPI003D0293BC